MKNDTHKVVVEGVSQETRGGFSKNDTHKVVVEGVSQETGSCFSDFEIETS